MLLPLNSEHGLLVFQISGQIRNTSLVICKRRGFLWKGNCSILFSFNFIVFAFVLGYDSVVNAKTSFSYHISRKLQSTLSQGKVASHLHLKGFHWEEWGKLCLAIFHLTSLLQKFCISYAQQCRHMLQKRQHIQRFPWGVPAISNCSRHL